MLAAAIGIDRAANEMSGIVARDDPARVDRDGGLERR
jgi:hypothetical protein